MLRRKKLIAISASAAVIGAAVAVALAQPRAQQQVRGDDPAVYEEIEQTLGTVPSFIRAYPEAGVAGIWEEMKGLELNPNTALSGKQKELIGLAVAAQIPCDYCTYFHTEAARLHGASDRELEEAVAVGAQTVHWTTAIVGLNPDDPELSELDELRQQMEQRQTRQQRRPQRPQEITDADAARQDIQATFGTVPNFLQRFPREALPGAWRTHRDLMLSEDTALSRDTKELIAAATATQTPCNKCVGARWQAAQQAGASNQQYAEAIGMAAITRHWSTVLNGNQIDEKQFQAETRQILRHLERQQQRQTRR